MNEFTSVPRSLIESCIEESYGLRTNQDTALRIAEYLEERGDSDLHGDTQALIRLATVNETYFFREHAQFSLFINKILPDMAHSGKKVRLCSSASSIGCEAYSLAMLMNDFRERTKGFTFEIDAFDLNAENIEIARRGMYGPNAFREDGRGFCRVLDRYVRSCDPGVEVDENLRSVVNFFRHNLMDGMPAPAYDCVFFRNALIYFTEDARRRILDSIVDALVPGGYLFVGTAETPVISHPSLLTRFEDDVFYFQKSDALDTMLTRRAVAATDAGTSCDELFSTQAAPRERGGRIDVDRIMGLLGETEHTTTPSPGASPSVKAILSHPDQGTDDKAAERIDETLVQVFSLIHTGGMDQARRIIEEVESRFRHELVFFLHGEIFRYTEVPERAEHYYTASLRENSRFWPAAYRLAESGVGKASQPRPYAIERAARSIERGRALGYECFIGGFSPDYYLELLAKRLAGPTR